MQVAAFSGCLVFMTKELKSIESDPEHRVV